MVSMCMCILLWIWVSEWVISVCTVCVAAGCVFDDGCYASAAYPTNPLRINKVAKIQRSYIRLGYLLLLLLLYFTQHCEAFINLEIYPAVEWRCWYLCTITPLLSWLGGELYYRKPPSQMSTPPHYNLEADPNLYSSLSPFNPKPGAQCFHLTQDKPVN